MAGSPFPDGDDFDGILLFLTTKVSQKFVNDFASKCLEHDKVFNKGPCWDMVDDCDLPKRHFIREAPVRLPETFAFEGKSPFEILEIFRKDFSDKIPEEVAEPPFSRGHFGILDDQSLKDGRVMLLTDLYSGPGARKTMIAVKEEARRERAEHGQESEPSDDEQDGSEVMYKRKNVVWVQNKVTARRIRFKESLHALNLIQQKTLLADVNVTDESQDENVESDRDGPQDKVVRGDTYRQQMDLKRARGEFQKDENEPGSRKKKKKDSKNTLSTDKEKD